MYYVISLQKNYYIDLDVVFFSKSKTKSKSHHLDSFPVTNDFNTTKLCTKPTAAKIHAN